MKSKLLSLMGASALLALATPALADKSDAITVDQQRDKISAARAEPGVQEYGAASLDQALAALPALRDNLDENEDVQAKAIIARIDALIETARTRAKIATLKRDVEQARTATAANRNAQVAEAQTAAANAQADAARAKAEADRLRAQMRDYQLKQTQLGATLVLQDVVFETGKADLKPGAAERLRPLAQYLQANPNVKVRIDGHTDSQGADAYNLALSNRRAAAVRTALAGMGVAAARVEAVGHGEAQPVASNTTQAGRQQNRRVEVTLVGQQANSFAAVN